MEQQGVKALGGAPCTTPCNSSIPVMDSGTKSLDCISERESGDRAPSIQGLEGVGGCCGNCLDTLHSPLSLRAEQMGTAEGRRRLCSDA